MKCPRCKTDLQRCGVVELQGLYHELDKRDRIMFDAEPVKLDDPEGYQCANCGASLDWEYGDGYTQLLPGTIEPEQEIAMEAAVRYTYQAFVEQENTKLWSVRFAQFPGLVITAKTREKAIDDAASALAFEINRRLDNGIEVPDPSHAIEPMAISVEPPEKDVDEDLYMTQAQACEALGLSSGRVSSLVKSGKLEGRVIGRRNMVSKASVENLNKVPRHPGRPSKGTSNA